MLCLGKDPANHTDFFIKNQEFRQTDTDKFSKFGALNRIFTNNRSYERNFWKSVKQRIERFFEKVYDCILIFTDWLG